MNLFLFVVASTEAGPDDLRTHWFPESSFAGELLTVREAIDNAQLQPVIGSINDKTILISDRVDEICVTVGSLGLPERRWQDMWCFVHLGDDLSVGEYRHEFVRIVRGAVVRFCDWGHDRAPSAHGPMLSEERAVLERVVGLPGLPEFWAEYSKAPMHATKRKKERSAERRQMRELDQKYARSQMKSVAIKGRKIQDSISPELSQMLGSFDLLLGKGVLESFVRNNPDVLSAAAPTTSPNEEIETPRSIDTRQHDIAAVLLRGLMSEAMGADCASDAFLSLKVHSIAL